MRRRSSYFKQNFVRVTDKDADTEAADAKERERRERAHRGVYTSDAFYHEQKSCTPNVQQNVTQNVSTTKTPVTFHYNITGMALLCHHVAAKFGKLTTTHTVLGLKDVCLKSKGCHEMCLEMLDCPFLKDTATSQRMPLQLRKAVGETIVLSQNNCQQCLGFYWNSRVRGPGSTNAV